MPRISLAISPAHLALVELQKRGGSFNPKRVGLQTLPPDLVRASLTEPNILNEAAFIDQLQSTAEKADFGRKLTLSVSLPEGSARSLVVALDQKPNSHEELKQMLEWKITRIANLKISDLRINQRQLSDENGQPRWLVAAVHEQVLEQYERIFSDLGWQAGAILPQHLSEAEWLVRRAIADGSDQLLVSTYEEGFVVVILRNDEPLLIREVTCSKAEQEDELFRLVIFYRDRLQPTKPLANTLIIADPNEQVALGQAISSALEHTPQKLAPLSLGLNIEQSAPFHQLAAATGLATLAY